MRQPAPEGWQRPTAQEKAARLRGVVFNLLKLSALALTVGFILLVYECDRINDKI